MAGERKGWKEESRKDWHTTMAEGETFIGNERIRIGALLRIADATELMAKRYQSLIEERDQFKRSKDYWQREYETMRRRLNAAKGQITKLKNASKAGSAA